TRPVTATSTTLRLRLHFVAARAERRYWPRPSSFWRAQCKGLGIGLGCKIACVGDGQGRKGCCRGWLPTSSAAWLFTACPSREGVPFKRYSGWRCLRSGSFRHPLGWCKLFGRGHAALSARRDLGGDRPLTSRSTGRQKLTAFGSLRCAPAPVTSA